MRYEVEFKYETGFSIEVDADTPEEAKALAQEEVDEMSVDHLPEMFPSDFWPSEVQERTVGLPYRRR